ncbi:hypothetical protein [Amycolatopsis sp. NPDC051102]|uniref:hypothetical protein n=1 Tax=Amycolatopsis sp. NPDC051102 TaxID=3155163 RepID=UPI003445EA69
MREAGRGLLAAAAAMGAMAVVALAALLLLGAGRVGGLGPLTAAVVALAVGGTAEFSVVPGAGSPAAVTGGGFPATSPHGTAHPASLFAGGLPTTPPAFPTGIPSGRLPLSLHGTVDVMPLGVSLLGAAILGALLLRHGRAGLPVRAATAAVAFPAGLAATALAARGSVTLRLPAGLGPRLPLRGALPNQLSATFGVPVAPTVAAAVIGVLAVAAGCWAVLRFPAFAAGLRGALLAWGVLTVLGLLAAGTFGGAAAAGGVLLVLPQVVSAVGLGMPVTSPWAAWPSLTWLPVIVLLGCGIVVAVRTPHRPGGPLRRAAVLAVRLALALGVVLAVMALLSRASIELGVAVFGFSLPVLAANPWLALATGLAGGAAAGLTGSLLVDGLRSRSSVSSRAWKR